MRTRTFNIGEVMIGCKFDVMKGYRVEFSIHDAILSN